MIYDHNALDGRIQKWIHSQGWSELRQLQKDAMGPIMRGDTDVLISASTASGKTESFFLPALSMCADQTNGFCILYISPLKALINDQHRRMSSLCEAIAMPITPWHGDSNATRKKAMKKNPSGLVLTTPESLESMLMNNASWAKTAFSNLQYIVIDEFHAFIGTERGHQLISLMHRIEHLTGRLKNPIPRVALSATLGEIEKVPLSLRTNKSMPCAIITGGNSGSSLQLQLMGYVEATQPEIVTITHEDDYDVEPIDEDLDDEDEDDSEPPEYFVDENGKKQSRVKLSAEYLICKDLYELTRGSSNLVFANSRSKTELIASRLSDMCKSNIVPNEYFPHHGSLSKEMRESLEARLQQSKLPTTAVCTMTLELGIDIGNIDAIYQVYPPHSVSSLRQRLGRSGRRDGNSVLRVMIPEHEIVDGAPLTMLLRMGLFQSIAMIHLLIKSRWYEPSDTSRLHLSTLLHQCMSVIAQYGSIRADQLFTLLCQQGPFQLVGPDLFMDLLRDMGKADLITQMSSGELTLGLAGEMMVGDYHFYAAFNAPEEYRVMYRGKFIGTTPVEIPLMVKQKIILSGRKWTVKEIDDKSKVILVARCRGGVPPAFVGSEMTIDRRIRQEMKQLYISGNHGISVGDNHISFLDETAEKLFNEGLSAFNDYGLEDQEVIQSGASVQIITWEGDKVVNTMVTIFQSMGVSANAYAGIIEISDMSLEDVYLLLESIAENGVPLPSHLASLVMSREIEKFDVYMSEETKAHNFGSIRFDCKGALEWIRGWISRNRQIQKTEGIN